MLLGAEACERKNPKTPELSPIADDVIAWGSIGSLVSLVYICRLYVVWQNYKYRKDIPANCPDFIWIIQILTSRFLKYPDFIWIIQIFNFQTSDILCEI